MRFPLYSAVTITGVVYALLGLALAGGGAWLVALGGSPFYVIAGLGILVTGALLVAGRREALWVYAAVLIGTLAWALAEIGLDWWPLAARGDVISPLGLWLLVPWIPRNLGRDTAPAGWSTTLPLWAGVVAGAAVLAGGLVSDYPPIGGTIPTPQGGPPPDGGQPAEDWRAYGRTQAGQRYSP